MTRRGDTALRQAGELLMHVGIGPLEVLLMMLFSGGFGLGAPLPEDPRLAQAAPAEYIAYSCWSGLAPADAKSANHTERLLAEPDVDRFLRETQGRMLNAISLEELRRLASLFLTKGGTVFLEDLELRGVDEPPLFHAGAVLHVGADAAEVRELIGRLMPQLPGPPAETKRIGDTDFWEVQPPNFAQPITLGVAGEYLVASVGRSSVTTIMQRMNSDPPRWLIEQRAKQAIPRVASRLYLNCRRIVQLCVAYDELQHGRAVFFFSPQIMSALGLDALDTIALASGLDETGSITRFLVETHSEPRGILAWFKLSALTAKDVQSIDVESPAALAVRFDAVGSLDEWLAMADQVDRDSGERARMGLQQLDQIVTMKFRDEFLGSLGSTLRVFAPPGPGGMVMGWTAAVQLRDRTTFVTAHDAIVARLKATFNRPDDGTSLLTSHQVAGRQAHVFSLSAFGLPISPAWCVTDDEFLLTMSLERLESLLETKVATSIATRPELRSAFAADAATLAVFYADTRQVASMIAPMAAMAFNPMMDPEVNRAMSQLPPMERIVAHLQPTAWTLARTPKGVEWTMRQTLPLGNMLSSAPVAAGWLLPAGTSARSAARRTSGANNLKQIALSLHNYHDTYGSLPAGYSASEDGKPLLSWRVHVLPYLEQAELYQKFRLDEPWDSPHNKELIPLMPEIYRSPASRNAAEEGLTNYLGVGGRDGVFVRPAKGHHLGAGFRNITDGTSNTIMTVEAADESAVTWTKPGDFAPTADDPMKGLLGLHDGGFQVGFGDGSVRFISKLIDPATLHALFTKSGGEVVGDF